jgi:hypothetical protein
LSSSAFAAFGLSNKANPVAIINRNAKICKKQFSNLGGCVDQDTLDKSISSLSNSLESSFDNTALMHTGYLNSAVTRLQNFCDKIAKALEKSTPFKKLSATDLQSLNATCTTLLTNFGNSTVLLDNLKGKWADKEKKSACKAAVRQIIQGTMCTVAAGNSSQYVTISNNITYINVSSSAAQLFFTSCFSNIQSLCWLTQAQKVFNKALSANANGYEKHEAVCSLVDIINCSNVNNATCNQTIVNNIFTTFLSPNSLPLSNAVDSNVTNSANDNARLLVAQTYAPAVRVLQSASNTQFVVDSNGVNIVDAGSATNNDNSTTPSGTNSTGSASLFTLRNLLSLVVLTAGFAF